MRSRFIRLLDLSAGLKELYTNWIHKGLSTWKHMEEKQGLSLLRVMFSLLNYVILGMFLSHSLLSVCQYFALVLQDNSFALPG